MEIATVAILLYVLSLPRWLEVFSFLLLSEDFAASFWLWAFRAGSSDGIGGTFSFGASPGYSGVTILFPQYEQNLLSSESSAPHLEHFISHISFNFPMKGSAV